MAGESELGKHEYWEAAYAREYKNFADFGDEGEIWFGEDVLEKLVTWSDDLFQTYFAKSHDVHVLDVGCGNGHVLYEFHQLGYQNLTGSDFSSKSIRLAEMIFQSKNISNIEFLVDDVLHSKLEKQFDVIIDKGTFDAISLGDQSHQLYSRSIQSLLKRQGVLVLTSCNFTKEELVEKFRHQLSYKAHIEDYKSFTFGGQEGNQVSTIAFIANP